MTVSRTISSLRALRRAFPAGTDCAGVVMNESSRRLDTVECTTAKWRVASDPSLPRCKGVPDGRQRKS